MTQRASTGVKFAALTFLIAAATAPVAIQPNGSIGLNELLAATGHSPGSRTAAEAKAHAKQAAEAKQDAKQLKKIDAKLLGLENADLHPSSVLTNVMTEREIRA